MSTKKIVPRANGEGAIGDNTAGIEKYWGGVYTNVLNSANAIELAAFNDGLQLKRSTSYVAGQVRFVSGLQAGLYLEATVDGITDSTAITIPSAVVPNTTTITDGTVIWIVRQLANTGNLSQAGERQKSTTYDVGNMATFPTLPYGWYLECTMGGITSASNLVITSPSVGSTVTDGTVVWTIRAVASTADIPAPVDISGKADITGANMVYHKDVITTSGTYTVPATGLYKITVKGGGGGGAASVGVSGSNLAGGGGGEGGTSLACITMQIGNTANIVVGAGGAGGSTAAGSTGGNSSVTYNGNTISAGGGVGGGDSNSVTVGGAGGAGTIVGSPGDSGTRLYTTGGDSTPGGSGGGAGGGAITWAGVGGAGSAGGGGAGGSGAYNAPKAGGAGGDGYVLFEYYTPSA